jgi:uracil phosphoribosyltransferase
MRVPISELIIFVEDEPVIKLFHEIFNSYRISIEICKNIRNELKNKDNCYIYDDIYFYQEKQYTNFKSLLEDYFFVPQLIEDNPKFSTFKTNLAILEKKQFEKKNEIIEQFNSIFRNNFSVINGLTDIYDMEIGAIKFYDFEWELMENSHLKQLFSTKLERSYLYLMEKEDSLLLRGPWIYYYTISFKNIKNTVTIPYFYEWYDRNIHFFCECMKNISDIKINSTINKKFTLAILDNLRNMMLTLINIAILKTQQEYKTSILSYDLLPKNHDVVKYYDLLTRLHELIIRICLVSDLVNEEIEEELSNILYLSVEYLKESKKKFNYEKQEKINERLIRRYIEIDNFWENYISINSSYKQLKAEKTFLEKKVNIFTILYGGIELPSILKTFFKNEKEEVNIIFYTVSETYFSRIGNSNALSLFGQKVSDIENSSVSTNILMDENVLTGSTLQKTIEYLHAQNLNISKLIVIRHPNLNRVAQMAFYNCYPNIEVLAKMTCGMFNRSPYSKIKERTNYGGEFLDELGVFTISGFKLVEYLYKNGLFEKGSEVDTLISSVH